MGWSACHLDVSRRLWLVTVLVAVSRRARAMMDPYCDSDVESCCDKTGKERLGAAEGMSTRASTSTTTLGGRWRHVARVAWAVIAMVAMGVFVASIPAYVSDILQ